jgi:bifunctional DNA-binding transcriptional regulator/antitoxin component of YhaV-PrlF toxin-antitoxin module
MRSKKNLSGKSTKSSGVNEPMADYHSGAGPIIAVDPTGRMVLPKKIRDHFAVNKFEVRATKGHIELIPVKPLRSLLGALPDLDVENLYREHDQEVDEEDA